jgi:hypothetical protein
MHGEEKRHACSWNEALLQPFLCQTWFKKGRIGVRVQSTRLSILL